VPPHPRRTSCPLIPAGHRRPATGHRAPSFPPATEPRRTRRPPRLVPPAGQRALFHPPASAPRHPSPVTAPHPPTFPRPVLPHRRPCRPLTVLALPSWSPAPSTAAARARPPGFTTRSHSLLLRSVAVLWCHMPPRLDELPCRCPCAAVVGQPELPCGLWQ
jgi:hypothetical protein